MTSYCAMLELYTGVGYPKVIMFGLLDITRLSCLGPHIVPCLCHRQVVGYLKVVMFGPSYCAMLVSYTGCWVPQGHHVCVVGYPKVVMFGPSYCAMLVLGIARRVVMPDPNVVECCRSLSCDPVLLLRGCDNKGPPVLHLAHQTPDIVVLLSLKPYPEISRAKQKKTRPNYYLGKTSLQHFGKPRKFIQPRFQKGTEDQLVFKSLLRSIYFFVF